MLVFGRGKYSLLLFSDYPDRGQTDPEAKIPRLILRLDERASKRTATNDGSVKIPELKQIQPKNFSKSRLKRSSKSMLSSSNKPGMVFPPYPKSSGTRFCFGIQENTPRPVDSHLGAPIPIMSLKRNRLSKNTIFIKPTRAGEVNNGLKVLLKAV